DAIERFVATEDLYDFEALTANLSNESFPIVVGTIDDEQTASALASVQGGGIGGVNRLKTLHF
ncbi:MAG TPA: hypothetical protein VEC58_03340, partial [Roseiarcus sp.]|nr:hypothetical protein [Roseiarcus sp.]